MNYQGSAVVNGGTITAGIAILPNTGTNNILHYVGIAVIVTGLVLLILQTIVTIRRKRK